MEYINEIRKRCYKKMNNALESNDSKSIELYRRIGLFLSDITFFMKVDIDIAFDILTLLDFSKSEIDDIYPRLISYDSLFSNNENNMKSK